jgi:ABC-2 type transport system permease protein
LGRRRSRAAPTNGAGVAFANGAGIPARAALTRSRRRPLSDAALAIAQKDARYLWRDPQLKAQLLSVLFATIFVVAPGLYSGSGNLRAGSGGPFLLLAPLPGLFLLLVFSLNALGMDRQGLQTLFLHPVRPLDIFWGKNLFAGTLAFAIEVAITLLKVGLSGDWSYAPIALTAGAAALFVMLGLGNVTSVLTPFRMRQMRMGETGSVSAENGFLRSLISMATMIATVVVLIPVAASVLLPLILDRPAWYIVVLPLAILYGVAFHQIASRLVAPILLRRIPEILAATVREA